MSKNIIAHLDSTMKIKSVFIVESKGGIPKKGSYSTPTYTAWCRQFQQASKGTEGKREKTKKKEEKKEMKTCKNCGDEYQFPGTFCTKCNSPISGGNGCTRLAIVIFVLIAVSACVLIAIYLGGGWYIIDNLIKLWS